MSKVLYRHPCSFSLQPMQLGDACGARSKPVVQWLLVRARPGHSNSNDEPCGLAYDRHVIRSDWLPSRTRIAPSRRDRHTERRLMSQSWPSVAIWSRQWCMPGRQTRHQRSSREDTAMRGSGSADRSRRRAWDAEPVSCCGWAKVVLSCAGSARCAPLCTDDPRAFQGSRVGPRWSTNARSAARRTAGLRRHHSAGSGPGGYLQGDR